MTLAVNMLICWRTDSAPPAPVVERILWMDPMGTDVAVIALHHPAALPTMRSYADITAALATGQAQVLIDDPYARLLARAEASLSPAQRAVRDARWALIHPLLQLTDTTLCAPAARAQAMQRFEQSWLVQQGLEPGSSEAKRRQKALRKQALKCLRWYWQRGQMPNALLPDFAHCGGKGKERQAQPTTKRGRASLRAAKSPDAQMIGINITGQVRQALLAGFQRFYVKGGLPWREAYDQTMEAFFCTALSGVRLSMCCLMCSAA